MSFDNHLPPPLICDLYRNVLYDIGSNSNVPKFSIPYLGDNKKKITIIVRYTDAPFIPDKQLQFLLDILSACKLMLEDVAIVNHHAERTATFNELLSKFSPEIILAFAIQPRELMLQSDVLDLSVIQTTNYKLLISPALDDLETDIPLKKQFWSVLRKLFDV